MRRSSAWAAVVVALASCALLSTAHAQQAPPGGGGATQGDGPAVPSHRVDIVLGRPTTRSIAISILATTTVDGYVTVSGGASATSRRTALRRFEKGHPVTLTLAELEPDSRYSYRFVYRSPQGKTYSRLPVASFHTARPAGASFGFAVQADSHLDSNSSTDVYRRTLAAEAAGAPDFLVDLGDTFMTDKYSPYSAAEKQYLAQRYYLGLIGRTAPVFLTLGNHDGEAGYRAGGGNAGMPAWSARTRNLFFPNPSPNAFYTGNAVAHPQAGQLRDYYAWEWGSALFIVLDPYWFTSAKPQGSDGWGWTLGRAQYDWLARTLRQSKAPLKFVFIHHLVGGAGKDARGGAEASPYFEWGGANLDGSDGFAVKRPGWGKPIHELLVENGASAVFHGHDHVFAHQQRDGIVYQEVPQPSNARAQQTTSATEYGYKAGVIIGGPGYVRIRVAGSRATVDYLRTSTSAGSEATTLAHSYTIG